MNVGKLAFFLLAIFYGTAVLASWLFNADNTALHTTTPPNSSNTTNTTSIQFQDVTTNAGITHVGMTFGASWGDYNGDGWPDLWVSNHFDPPSLYLNQGDGTFVDIAPQVWSAPPYADTHGAAWGDFDNDSDQDLMEMVGSDQGTGKGPDFFFVNTSGTLVEQAAEYGLAEPYGRGRTPVWLDWSQDGHLDLLLTNLARSDGQGPTTLYQQFDGNFQPTIVGFDAPDNVKFGQLADLSGDGRLDLIIHGWPFPQRIYDMTTNPFTDITTAIGLSSSSIVADIILADFNNDLHTDLYVLRDDEDDSDYAQIDDTTLHTTLLIETDEKGITFQTDGDVTFNLFEWRLNEDQIFIGADGHNPATCCTFTLSPLDPTVIGLLPHTPGVDNGIYVGYDDANHLWQLSVSSAAGYLAINGRIQSTTPISHTTPLGFDPLDRFLYHRLLIHANNRYEDQTIASGLAVPRQCLSGAAGDFDNDMDTDFYLLCSQPVTNLPNVLYENRNDGTFVPVPQAGGAEGSSSGIGDSVAIADYDRDGFLDIFLVNGAGSPPFPFGPDQLFRNQGNGNHWLEVNLIGRTTNRDGLGARIIATAGGVTQLREQGGGIHDHAQNDKMIHFGLGENTEVTQLVIYWPNGRIQTLHHIPADQVLSLYEPYYLYLPILTR